MKKKFFRLLAIASVASSLAVMSGGCAKQMVKSDAEEMKPSEPAKTEDQFGGMGTDEPLESGAMDRPLEAAGGEILEGRTTSPNTGSVKIKINGKHRAGSAAF